MNYDEKKEIKKKKYKKYTIGSVAIIALTFLLEYSMEFLLDSIFEPSKKENVESSYDVSVNYSFEYDEGIETPFEPSDINIEIVKVEKNKFYSDGSYLVEARIKNNSDTPLKDIWINLSFDDGETSAYIGGESITIMPGKSYVTNGSSDGEIKNTDSGEVLSGNVYWVGKNKKLFSTDIDFLLDITESYKTN